MTKLAHLLTLMHAVDYLEIGKSQHASPGKYYRCLLYDQQQ